MTDLVGPAYDFLWSVLALVAIALLVVALTRWFKAHPAGALAIVQVVAIVVLPIIGPTAYLLATSDARPRHQGEMGAQG
ncbi:hypothetical protein [Georgenia muralis]|uniref:Phospholipase D-like protein n=1 Tax=Georgenia muralis TaxID=154117 RepID=A0A3N4Z7C5_9MICO|nr:hypothetical protein [Georgenia muralis]RPF28213.1 hypothetical protein EDD32_2729 [Georgenia muralis]